jgi:carbon monoxide dehydrogenase subunit G
VIDYRGSFEFDLPPEAMWDALGHYERFEGWWGWLHEFHADGRGLETGSVLQGVVSPPVPYEMRVSVCLDKSVRPLDIAASVTGDLEGTAHLHLAPRPGGTRVEVDWKIEMRQRSMRLAARLASPLLRWGHDRVVDMTVSGFRRNLGREIERAGPEGEETGPP